MIILYFCFLSEGSYTWEWTGRARRAWCTSRPSALRTPARFSGLSRQDIPGIQGFPEFICGSNFSLSLDKCLPRHYNLSADSWFCWKQCSGSMWCGVDPSFSAYYFLKVHLHHFSKIKSPKEITKQ